MNKTYHYDSFDQDLVKSKDQHYKLPDNYKWINTNPAKKLVEALLYPAVLFYSFCYQKFYARVSIANRKVLKKAKKCGYYLFSSHTQVFGDVVNHFVTTFPKHPYLICSSANLGVAIIGKILPFAGALPIPNSIEQLKELNEAIRTRISQGKVIVTYPEAHVWPWYTGIRPMSSAAFHFPISIEAPVFVATTTYQKTKFRKKPKTTIYIDGPIIIPDNLTRKEKILFMKEAVQQTMQNRAKLSTYKYIEYIPKG